MSDFTDDMEHYDPEIEENLYLFGGLLSCKFCGEDNLHWELIDDLFKYKLCNNNRIIHECYSNIKKYKELMNKKGIK